MEYILHIGLPKTGTTFLQKEVFPKLRGVNFGTPDTVRLSRFKIKKDKINLYSTETFLGDVTRDSLLFDRLKNTYKQFPRLKVIMCVRNLNEWLPSLYNQYVKGGGTHSFKRWVLNDLNMDFLDTYRLIEKVNLYCDDVLVLDYSYLECSPHLYVRAICDFVGVKTPAFENKVHGKSLPMWFIHLLRFTNHFIKLGKIYRRFK